MAFLRRFELSRQALITGVPPAPSRSNRVAETCDYVRLRSGDAERFVLPIEQFYAARQFIQSSSIIRSASPALRKPQGDAFSLALQQETAISSFYDASRSISHFEFLFLPEISPCFSKQRDPCYDCRFLAAPLKGDQHRVIAVTTPKACTSFKLRTADYGGISNFVRGSRALERLYPSPLSSLRPAVIQSAFRRE